MGNKCRFYADVQSLQTEVTGSNNLITVSYPNGYKEMFLVDFGLYQGNDEQIVKNPLIGFHPEKLSGVLLTHAHVDHCGRIPMLYKYGATCKVFMTEDTMRITEKLLHNTAQIIESNKQAIKPIYTLMDYENALKEFRAVEYLNYVNITDNIRAMFIQNMHVPGASSVYVVISYPGEKDITLFFSGDYNYTNAFSSKEMEIPYYISDNPISMMLLESTYGSRKKYNDVMGLFALEMEQLVKEQKTTIVIPAFSFGRYQTILLELKRMQEKGTLNGIPIYLDGGLGISLTYMWKYLETVELKDFMPKNVLIVEERKSLMCDDSQKIIITTSGMGNFGPAREYLPHYISDENAVIYLTGYTSPDSTARKIYEAEIGDTITVSGIVRKKRAIVKCTSEFSSHAREEDLIDLTKKFKKINFLLLNHGDDVAKESLSENCYQLPHIKDVGIINGETDFRISCYGLVKTLHI